MEDAPRVYSRTDDPKGFVFESETFALAVTAAESSPESPKRPNRLRMSRIDEKKINTELELKLDAQEHG